MKRYLNMIIYASAILVVIIMFLLLLGPLFSKETVEIAGKLSGTIDISHPLNFYEYINSNNAENGYKFVAILIIVLLVVLLALLLALFVYEGSKKKKNKKSYVYYLPIFIFFVVGILIFLLPLVARKVNTSLTVKTVTTYTFSPYPIIAGILSILASLGLMIALLYKRKH